MDRRLCRAIRIIGFVFASLILGSFPANAQKPCGVTGQALLKGASKHGGIRITVWNGFETTTGVTETDGSYCVRLTRSTPGTFLTAFATRDGYTAQARNVRVEANIPTVPVPSAIVPTIVLEPMPASDQSGLLIGVATIQVNGGRPWHQEGIFQYRSGLNLVVDGSQGPVDLKTDENGIFAVELAPGMYQLRAGQSAPVELSVKSRASTIVPLPVGTATVFANLVGVGSGRRPPQIGRPTFTARELTLGVTPPGVDCRAVPNNCFLIHYTTDEHNFDGTNNPDRVSTQYVLNLRTALSEVESKQVGMMGWPVPPPDCATQCSRSEDGGTPAVDVYVKQVGCDGVAIVYAENRGGFATSYIVIDNKVFDLFRDMNCINKGPDKTGLAALGDLQVLRHVLSHEYHHVIQNGMVRPGLLSAPSWLMEATSNFMSEITYGDIGANHLSWVLGDFGPLDQNGIVQPQEPLPSNCQYPVNSTFARNLYNSPPTSLDCVSYGQWFWLRYLSERFGNDMVREIWDYFSQNLCFFCDLNQVALQSYNEVLLRRGTSLAEAWVDFSGKHYAKSAFRGLELFPNIVTERTYNTYPIRPEGHLPSYINHLARRYAQFLPPIPPRDEKNLVVTLDPRLSATVGTVILGDANGTRRDQRMNGGAAIVRQFGDASPFLPASDRIGQVALAITNARMTDNEPFDYCSPDESLPPFLAAQGCTLVSGPTVTPSPGVVVPATEPGGTRPYASAALERFLFLAQVADPLDRSAGFRSYIGHSVATRETLFPIGTTAVLFRSQDAFGFEGIGVGQATVVQGQPQLVGVVIGSGNLSSELRYLDVRFENVGTGLARQITLDMLQVATIGGAGTVALREIAYLGQSRNVPFGIEDLGPMQSTHNIRFLFSVPLSVTNFVVIENLNIQDAAGAVMNFSLAQPAP